MLDTARPSGRRGGSTYQSNRPLHHVSPKLPQTLQATGCAAPEGRIANQQVPRKESRARLEQGVESGMPLLDKLVGRCSKIDRLARQDLECARRASQGLQVREMRMKIESGYAV